MALDAPAPVAGPRRRAEDGEEIPLGVADVAALLLLLVQDGLQAHDGGGGDVALLAGAGPYQGQGGLLLGGGHVEQRQALARRVAVLVLQRYEVPVVALLAVERQGGSLL